MVSTYLFKVRPVLVLLVLMIPLPAQTAKPPADPAGGASVSVTGGIATPTHSPSAKELREAQISADTEKLYELAQQLKVELDKSTKDTLSLTVVRKAAEIEKLAHSISDRMKSN